VALCSALGARQTTREEAFWREEGGTAGGRDPPRNLAILQAGLPRQSSRVAGAEWRGRSRGWFLPRLLDCAFAAFFYFYR
jgi:hypothetical protein